MSLPLDCLDEKQKLREKLIAARTIIFPRQRLEFSNKICDKLLQLPEIQYSENILSYSVMGAEVDLGFFNSEMQQSGKKVFYVQETVEKTLELTEKNIGVCLVPGVSFDLYGNRLGRGRGFYDRLLPQLNCPKVGIVFDLQIVEKLPVEPHDAKVDLIASEKRLIRP